MAFAVTLAMLLVVMNPAYHALGETTVWTVVTVAIVLQPTVGSAFFQGMQGVLGTLLGSAMSLAIQGIILGVAETLSYQRHPVSVVSLACGLICWHSASPASGWAHTLTQTSGM